MHLLFGVMIYRKTNLFCRCCHGRFCSKDKIVGRRAEARAKTFVDRHATEMATLAFNNVSSSTRRWQSRFMFILAGASAFTISTTTLTRVQILPGKGVSTLVRPMQNQNGTVALWTAHQVGGSNGWLVRPTRRTHCRALRKGACTKPWRRSIRIRVRRLAGRTATM